MVEFPSAIDAREYSRNNTVIFNEIRDIESSILEAIDNKNFDTIISNSYMTSEQSGISYWRVWQEFDENDVLYDQMSQVIKYFQDLKYSVSRKTNMEIGNIFYWEIKW